MTEEQDLDDGLEPPLHYPGPDDADELELPPVIDHLPVEGAEGLPDEVKNGDIEGESHPSVDHKPIIEDREN